MRRLWILALVAGCAEPLRDDVTPIDELDYKTWKQVQVHGDAPGHAGFRTIYANDAARDPDQISYQPGSILIKEVYDDDGGAPGALRHIAVMRRLDSFDDDGGWYFTEVKGDGPEEHYDFCFRRCHAAAPYSGAWLDYRD